MNPDNLNLYIVDDDESIRRSVGSLLLARLDDCSIKSFESGEAFLRGANLNGSGIVILDRDMPGGMSGLDVHEVLHDQRSPLVVVFLSSKGDIPVAVDAMQKGAISWLPKPCSDEQLLGTINTARQRAKAGANRRRKLHDARQKWNTLSLREMQVCALTVMSLNAIESAGYLTRAFPDRPINHRTVENHRAKAYTKLDVIGAIELEKFFRDNELVELAEESLNCHPDGSCPS